MLSKTHCLIHISLLPVYITIALYLNIVPSPIVNNLSPILQLAKNRLPTRLFNPTFLNFTRATSSSTSPVMAPMNFVPRKSEERGHADHGWLKTFHTFSFAMYQDHNHELFGSLRVINEDRVAPRTGFGTHSHREFEIFSYVVAGQLEHKDSLGNTEILSRGDIQMTSAGTGISHSEKAYGSAQVHFLQIWSLPHTSRLQPKYFTRHFSDEEKLNKLVKVVAPIDEEGVSSEREAKGPVPVHSALTMYAGLLEGGVRAEVKMGGSKGYVHVIQKSGYKTGAAQGATVRFGQVKGGNETVLREGDGAYVFVGQRGNVLSVENIGEGIAEVLVFDLE